MTLLKIFLVVLVVSAAVAFLFPLVVKERNPLTNGQRKGKASYYGEGYRGARMANGDRFNPEAMTAASWNYPLGTWVSVSHGVKFVTVQITDRGPALALKREIDLSEAAFAKLAPLKRGVIEVTVTPLSK